MKHKPLIIGGALILVGLVFLSLAKKPQPAPATPPEKPAQIDAEQTPTRTPDAAAHTATPDTPTPLTAQLQALLQQGDSDDDIREWQGALYDLTKSLDLDGVHTLLALCDSGQLPVLFTKMTRLAAHDRFLRLDTAAALQSADRGGVPPENVAGWLKRSVRWCAQQPNSDPAWLESLALNNLNQEQLGEAWAVGGARGNRLDLVTSGLARQQQPEQRAKIVKEVAAVWAGSNNLTDLDQLIDQLSPEEQRIAQAEAAVFLITTQPALALAQLEPFAEDPDDTRYWNTVTRMLTRWADVDPEAASSWVLNTLPDSEKKHLCLSLTVRDLVQQAPQSFGY